VIELTELHQSKIQMRVIGFRCLIAVLIAATLLLSLACSTKIAIPIPKPGTVPHSSRWGIYELDPVSQVVDLIYGSDIKIEYLDLNKQGTRFVFAQFYNGEANENAEVCTFDAASRKFERLTNNNLVDLYPVWSPDGSKIAFLSLRIKDLDIFLMNNDGSEQARLFDSGDHDADIDWEGNNIVFTSGSRVWLMRSDGSGATTFTAPPQAGVWGKANLPFGDYDPRISPDGRLVAFERLEKDDSPHGNFNIFSVNVDGSQERRLTDTGYSQGIVNWSHSSDKLVYVVAAIGEEAKYDIYVMDFDGSGIKNITPEYFPPDFICRTPVFSPDDARIYFIGEWWQ